MDIIYSFFAGESERRVMESSRFCPPKSTEQKRSRIQSGRLRYLKTRNMHARKNKDAIKEKVGFGKMDLATIQPVTCRIEQMSAETLNFWLTKFKEEVTNQSGGRYPPKTLNLLICGLNRHLVDGKHDNNFNVLEKTDRRTYFELP